MITVEQLFKSFNSTPVLQGVDHKQDAGETVVLIGPSGCGKSTFLRCLNQLETADAGRITIDSITLQAGNGSFTAEDHARQKELRLQTGMVFQSFNLFPHLTVLENVTRAPIVVRHLSRTDATELAMRLLAKVGLENRACAFPCQLSGGQQQRVAIARALAMQPRVLLFDEP